jgi:E1A/CREB-binding protein
MYAIFSMKSVFVSGNFHDTISSTLKPTGNQMNAANTLPTSRMECTLHTSQTTKQPLQPKPVIKTEVLDQTENVIFSKSQLPYQHQQQHYFEPNRPYSQFVNEPHLGSYCDEQLSNQGALPYNELTYSKATEGNDKSDQMYRQYVSHNNIQITLGSQQLLSSHAKGTKLVNSIFQRPMSQDATEHVTSDWPNAGCAMTPIDHKPPKLLTRGSEQATSTYDLQTLRLIKFIHANISPCPLGDSCKSPLYARLQEILKHSNDCQTVNCLYGYCKQSKEAIYHYNNCVNELCPICSKAKSLSHCCDQTNKRNTFERSINGANDDRMSINMVTAETYDDQSLMSKRLKLQLLPPNVSSADASVSQACTSIVSQRAHSKHLGQDKMSFPKQEQNIEINIQSPRKAEIIGSGVVGKTSAIQTHVVHDVSNALDSYTEEKNSMSDKDTNESVIDIKINANGSTDAMLSKIEKTKRKGISLMELFTPEQIHEHVRSLRQWVGQVCFFTIKNRYRTSFCFY